MRRSEFEKALRKAAPELWADSSYGADSVMQEVDKLNIPWDPEEPEVLWEADWTTDATPRRILADGRIEYSPAKGRWLPLDCPTTRELARRLLAERAEKPGLADLFEADEEAVAKVKSWLEEERESRDLGGEIKEAEAVRPEPRFARIVKCGTPTYWYAGSVGRIFEILGENPENFLAIQGPGLEGWVGREDCEIVPILRQWPDLGS